jgi:hypothetical protein
MTLKFCQGIFLFSIGTRHFVLPLKCKDIFNKLPSRCSPYSQYLQHTRPPLWFSGWSSWQQIQSSGFDSRRYQILWEAVSVERGPLSLESTTEELLGKKNAAPVYKTEITAGGIRCADYEAPIYPQELALNSSTSGDHAVGIVRSRTRATEFVFFVCVGQSCSPFRINYTGPMM